MSSETKQTFDHHYLTEDQMLDYEMKKYNESRANCNCILQDLVWFEMDQVSYNRIWFEAESAYCLITDHVHIILQELTKDMDQMKFIDPEPYEESTNYLYYAIKDQQDNINYSFNEDLIVQLSGFITRELAKHNIRCNNLRKLILECPQEYHKEFVNLTLLILTQSWKQVKSGLKLLQKRLDEDKK
jgi:hypothetical protein